MKLGNITNDKKTEEITIDKQFTNSENNHLQIKIGYLINSSDFYNIKCIILNTNKNYSVVRFRLGVHSTVI